MRPAPEVAAAFPGPGGVNAVLKSLIRAGGGDRAKFAEAMRLVPDVEPEQQDGLPPKGT